MHYFTSMLSRCRWRHGLILTKASATSVDRLLQLITTRFISWKLVSSFGVVPIHLWVCMNTKTTAVKSLDLNMLLQINKKILSRNLYNWSYTYLIYLICTEEFSNGRLTVNRWFNIYFSNKNTSRIKIWLASSMATTYYDYEIVSVLSFGEDK